MNIILKTAFVITASLALTTASAVAMKSKTLDQHFKVDSGQRIEIKGFSGSHIRFKSWDKPEVYIHLTVSVSASNEKYEQSFIDAVKIEENRTSDFLSLSFDDASKSIEQNRSFWDDLKSFFGGRSVSRKVEGDIFVPATNDLSANIPYADVSLENMKGKLRFTGTSNELFLRNCSSLESISNDYGKTSIVNSGGSLSLHGQSGPMTVEDFDGDIRCNAPYSKLRFSRITRQLSIQSQSGEVTVQDVKADVAISADYSPITVTNVAGFADIKSQSGRIIIRQVDGAHVNANYSDIEITGVSGKSNKDIIIGSQSGSLALNDIVGNVRIDNPYSRMQLNKITGNIRLSSQSSKITGDDITGDWDSDTQYSAIRVNRLNAKQIRATNSSESVTFTLASVPSRIDIKNQYANVSVMMPKGFSGDINLDVEYGSIETGLPVTVKNKSNSGYAIGKIGSGSGSITIETTSGRIALQEK